VELLGSGAPQSKVSAVALAYFWILVDSSAMAALEFGLVYGTIVNESRADG
jgi:hypothetical protein